MIPRNIKDMFKITEADFKKGEYGSEKYLVNWPMLYILENGKQAYVGQSNHVKTRMAEHLSNKQKRIFEKVHFIYSSKFNQSVTLDYEAKLIQYVVADELFEVTNGNGGMADKAYFEKQVYDSEFHQLWRKLQKEKLAKHSIEEIENSDLFKYSPFKELNDDQREAVDSIINTIDASAQQTIVVNGMPGSGKTIVAIYILKYLRDDPKFQDKTIGFVVPQTSLRKTMERIFKSIYNLSPADVLGPSDVTKKKYDILLVDEAHRLHQYKNISYMGAFRKSCERIGLTTEADEVDWILHQSKCAILFYDRDQVVGPSGIGVQRFSGKLQSVPGQTKRLISYHKLLTQMRVRGGNSYIDFVNEILSGKAKEKREIDNYEFRLITDFGRFDKLHYEKESKYGLTRMAAGYAWPWDSKKDKSKYDILLDGVSKQWNYETEGWVHMEGAIDQVGCIHSIQGYDLNYAFIIMGNEIGYDPSRREILVYPDHYHDQNGKKTATYEELKQYILNIYYVLMTRGIRGTYLYICDKALREYISNVVITE